MYLSLLLDHRILEGVEWQIISPDIETLTNYNFLLRDQG